MKHISKSEFAILSSILLASPVSAWSKKEKKVLLKNVQTLTLHKDKKTTHRRVSAVPQLNCIGGNGCRYHQVETMRCENAGSDYDPDSIQWTCKTDIPDYFKLGSTEVKCEGYSSPHDPFILSGSCGVEYRLLLTDKGEARYGYSYSTSSHKSSALFNFFFWLLFVGVVLWMLRSILRNMRDNANNPGPRRPPFDGWGGGGGGGGDGWFRGNDRPDDPPPPYSQQPPRKRQTQSHQPRQQGAGGQGWRPGFWSGVLGGGAAGYFAGQRGNQGRRAGNQGYNLGGFNRGSSNYNGRNDDAGEGSSSGGSRYTSTGFGGTSNR